MLPRETPISKRAGDKMLPRETPISSSCSSDKVEPTVTLKNWSDRIRQYIFLKWVDDL